MKTKTTKTKQTDLPQSPDFERALELLDALGRAQDELKNIEAISGDHLRGVLRDIKPRYAHFQAQELDALADLENLCRKHPEWFEAKATLKTLHGDLTLRSTPPKLVVDNPEAALLKLKLYAEKAYDHSPSGDKARAEFLARYIRTREELNLDALKGAGETIIAVISGALVTEEKFSAKPATLDLAKAVEPQKEAA
jgi:phage host-nuclease inhibitor protein Gam